MSILSHKKQTVWVRCSMVMILCITMVFAAPGVLLAKGEGPPEKIDVIVVHARGSGQAAAVVRGQNGQVNKELRLINAVSVSLPLKAIEALRKNKNVLAIYPDADLRISLAAPESPLLDVDISSPQLYTVADSFNIIAYNNNDGNKSWTGAWQETREHDGPMTGMMRVTKNTYCPSGYCLRIGGDAVYLNDYSITRQADLRGATYAIVEFNYRRWVSDNDNNASIEFQVSPDNGATWQTLSIYNLSKTDYASVAQAFDISPYASSAMQIRFVGTGKIDETRYLFIDDIRISYAYPKADQKLCMGVDQLHDKGITGEGVTVAVLDSGYWSTPGIDYDTQGNNRVLAYHDVLDECFLELEWIIEP